MRNKYLLDFLLQHMSLICDILETFSGCTKKSKLNTLSCVGLLRSLKTKEFTCHWSLLDHGIGLKCERISSSWTDNQSGGHVNSISTILSKSDEDHSILMCNYIMEASYNVT